MEKRTWIDIKNVKELKKYVHVGAEFSVGWQHEHILVKVTENGFWWVCQTGDCGGALALEEVTWERAKEAFEGEGKDKLAYMGDNERALREAIFGIVEYFVQYEQVG